MMTRSPIRVAAENRFTITEQEETGRDQASRVAISRRQTMPKLKSKSSAKKRFTVTAKGKIKFKRAKKSHILTKKSTKVKRGLRKCGYMAKSDELQIRRILPYLV